MKRRDDDVLIIDATNIHLYAKPFEGKKSHHNADGSYTCTGCGARMDDFGGPGGLCQSCCIEVYQDAKLGDITGDTNNGADTYNGGIGPTIWDE